MRTVHIADDVYAALQRMAVPFEDDINDVLHRLLRRAGEIATPLPRHRLEEHPHPNGRSAPAQPPKSTGNGAGPSPQPYELNPDETGTVIVHKRTTSGATLPQSTYRFGRAWSAEIDRRRARASRPVATS
jgi:hypothetical protein